MKTCYLQLLIYSNVLLQLKCPLEQGNWLSMNNFSFVSMISIFHNVYPHSLNSCMELAVLSPVPGLVFPEALTSASMTQGLCSCFCSPLHWGLCHSLLSTSLGCQAKKQLWNTREAMSRCHGVHCWRSISFVSDHLHVLCIQARSLTSVFDNSLCSHVMPYSRPTCGTLKPFSWQGGYCSCSNLIPI